MSSSALSKSRPKTRWARLHDALALVRRRDFWTSAYQSIDD